MTVTGRGVESSAHRRDRLARGGRLPPSHAEERRALRARPAVDAARRRELVPGLRPLPAVHDRCARQPHHRCGRQRVHRLRHGVRRPRRRSLAPDPGRGAPAPRRERDLLHVPGRGRHRAGGGDQGPLRRRSRALQQLGHRGHDGRDPRRAWLHRAREGRSSSRVATTATTTTCSSASSRRASDGAGRVARRPCPPAPASRARGSRRP